MRLKDLKGSVIKPGLETISELLRRLGNPQLDFKSVHIAGTNGKGSCAAMLHEMCVRAGYRAALYTSPHLHKFNERVKIDRDEISDRDLDRLDESVGGVCGGIEPTYFEYTTAMAFKYFSEKDPDIAIVEVGLGGRLDATNLLYPVVTVITPISMDHQDFLGDALSGIAYEKAGIMKRNVMAVVSRQEPEAMSVIEKRARALPAPLWIEGRDFDADTKKYPYFDFIGRKFRLDGLRCKLIGRHQTQNSAMALAAAECLVESGYRLDEKILRDAVANVGWPCRLEYIEGNPPVLLDGTHNPGGAAVLARALEDDFADKKIRLVMGMQVTKDLDSFLSILRPRLSAVHVTPLREVTYYDPEDVANRARKLGLEAQTHTGVREALDAAKSAAGEDGVVLVAGSLYLVGEASELLGIGCG